jgi:hypothetical protein
MNDEQRKDAARRLAERQRACREAMGDKWLGHPARRMPKKGERVKCLSLVPPVSEAKK